MGWGVISATEELGGQGHGPRVVCGGPPTRFRTRPRLPDCRSRYSPAVTKNSSRSRPGMVAPSLRSVAECQPHGQPGQPGLAPVPASTAEEVAGSASGLCPGWVRAPSRSSPRTARRPPGSVPSARTAPTVPCGIPRTPRPCISFAPAPGGTRSAPHRWSTMPAAVHADACLRLEDAAGHALAVSDCPKPVRRRWTPVPSARPGKPVCHRQGQRRVGPSVRALLVVGPTRGRSSRGERAARAGVPRCRAAPSLTAPYGGLRGGGGGWPGLCLEPP